MLKHKIENGFTLDKKHIKFVVIINPQQDTKYCILCHSEKLLWKIIYEERQNRTKKVIIFNVKWNRNRDATKGIVDFI